MTNELPITIRPALESDVAFIFRSWLKSYKNSWFAKNIENTIYYSEHHKVLERLMSEKTVLIACNSDDTDQIYGFMCCEKTEGINVIHFIYVKHVFRNMGIAKRLLEVQGHDPKTAGVYTHHTRIAEKLAPKANLVYHPYLAFKY